MPLEVASYSSRTSAIVTRLAVTWLQPQNVYSVKDGKTHCTHKYQCFASDHQVYAVYKESPKIGTHVEVKTEHTCHNCCATYTFPNM
jgi:hypothetical protein